MTLATASPTTASSEPSTASRQWLPAVGLAVLFLGTLRATLMPVGDPDTWWHLRLGREFRGDWSLADPGQLSPFATRPWFATQWMPEVLASWFEQWFGLPGVAWLFSAAVVALVVALYVVCRRQAGALPAVLAAGFGYVGAAASLSPRPQVVTFILLAVVTGAWLRTADDLRPRWWLVPLTWVWACCHGMWIAGAAVGAAVVLGLALDRRLDRPRLLRLLAVPLAGVMAAALTPVGPKLLLAPLATSSMAPFVSEWQPPSFRENPNLLVALMLAVVVVTWARRGGLPWSHLAVLALASGWTLLSDRTVALGAIMAAPLLASALQAWLPVRAEPRSRRGERLTLLAASALALAVTTVALPTTAALPGDVPTRLDASLDRLPAGTVVLNDYELGGWLTWRHPHVAPVIDGMTDAYTTDHMVRYLSAVTAQEGWRDFVTATSPAYALLQEGSPLATALTERLAWRTVGRDEGYALLRPPGR